MHWELLFLPQSWRGEDMEVRMEPEVLATVQTPEYPSGFLLTGLTRVALSLKRISLSSSNSE